jgi:hypothetical protein
MIKKRCPASWKRMQPKNKAISHNELVNKPKRIIINNEGCHFIILLN